MACISSSSYSTFQYYGFRTTEEEEVLPRKHLYSIGSLKEAQITGKHRLHTGSYTLNCVEEKREDGRDR